MEPSWSWLNTMVQHAKNVRLLPRSNGDKRQDLMLLGGDAALLQVLALRSGNGALLFSAPKTILCSRFLTDDDGVRRHQSDGKLDVLIGDKENIITIL